MPPGSVGNNPDPKYLFVGGPPRSGTTVLANLLNRHPRVAIGIERYKYLYGNSARRAEITPALFEPARFFDFRQEETNIRKRNYKNVRELERKYESVYYRGDKWPAIARLRGVLDRALRRTCYVLIFRDVARVCSSWNARAANPDDSWPEENDYRAAVRRMNRDFRGIVTLASSEPGKFLVVNYDELFGENGYSVLVALLRQLGLAAHPHVTEYLRQNVETYRTLHAKPLRLDASQMAFIEGELDWPLVARLKEIALKPVEEGVT
jgi:sulfotransferase family protein